MIIVNAKITGEGKISKAHRGDAGYDIYSVEDVVISAKGRQAVKTEIYIEIPDGYMGLVYSRSGLSFKHGIEVGAGVIDSNYRGEIKVILYNHSEENYHVKVGDKIAQLIVIPIADVEWERVKNLTPSNRNNKGFGSSNNQQPDFII